MEKDSFQSGNTFSGMANAFRRISKISLIFPEVWSKPAHENPGIVFFLCPCPYSRILLKESTNLFSLTGDNYYYL